MKNVDFIIKSGARTYTWNGWCGNDGFCIKNVKLCIKNKDFCIKHDEFSEADGSHLLLAQRLAESCVSQNDGFSFQKTRNCALKKVIFVFKMMNFSGETGAHDSEWSVFNGRILISFISES